MTTISQRNIRAKIDAASAVFLQTDYSSIRPSLRHVALTTYYLAALLAAKTALQSRGKPTDDLVPTFNREFIHSGEVHASCFEDLQFLQKQCEEPHSSEEEIALDVVHDARMAAERLVEAVRGVL